MIIKDKNNNIIKMLKENNFKINNKKKIINLINNYGYHKIINCYGSILKSKKRVKTNDIIKIFKADKIIASVLIDYIWDFEQILNTSIINFTLSSNNLPDDYVLNLVTNPGDTILKKKGFGTFDDELYQYASKCNFLNMYNDITKIPLNKLSLSWSFNTSINFLFLQNDNVKMESLKKFNLDMKDCDNFISSCHSIRKFRNIISHNDIVCSAKLNFYQREFNILLNKIYKTKIDINTNINVYKIIKLLESFLSKNINKKIIKELKKIKMNKNLRKKILSSMNTK